VNLGSDILSFIVLLGHLAVVLKDLMSLKPVGVTGARNFVRSSYS